MGFFTENVTKLFTAVIEHNYKIVPGGGPIESLIRIVTPAATSRSNLEPTLGVQRGPIRRQDIDVDDAGGGRDRCRISAITATCNSSPTDSTCPGTGSCEQATTGFGFLVALFLAGHMFLRMREVAKRWEFPTISRQRQRPRDSFPLASLNRSLAQLSSMQSMNTSAFWWKVGYIVAIAVLIFPLQWLSQPAQSAAMPRGGKLGPAARASTICREANLGEIDARPKRSSWPRSGLRGVAVQILWDKANYYKMIEDWSGFGAVLTQIANLQPHF